MKSLTDWGELLYQAMLRADRDGARLLVEQALSAGLDGNVVITGILDPVLHRIGELWGRQEVSLAQAYVGAKIAEDVLKRCLQDHQAGEARPSKGTLVLGNIEDDFHSLGRRMVHSFLEAQGWQVLDLGNDVVARDFVDTAVQAQARFVAVSAMMLSTARNIVKVRQEIDARGLAGSLHLVVGGAVFNWRPELVAEVGGELSAPNAAEVDAVLCRFLAARGES